MDRGGSSVALEGSMMQGGHRSEKHETKHRLNRRENIEIRRDDVSFNGIGGLKGVSRKMKRSAGCVFGLLDLLPSCMGQGVSRSHSYILPYKPIMNVLLCFTWICLEITFFLFIQILI